ncbi:MAG: aminoacyl-tRNA hydrolase [Bdellovibrionaceae bacterium]|nr:aminoacyl-tRNA hydrolase [Bdellovibrio sp.]
MWLVIGLGNPGCKYAMTRHNVGFMVMDVWMNSINAGNYRDEHKAETKKFKLDIEKKSEEILVMKPQTFMNLSGQSVQAAMAFYKIPLEQILIVHDDVDQPLGSMKFHKNRGHGGQNGVRNITELLGTMDYARLKIGVGRPEHPGFDIGDYVLSAFTKDEDKVLKKVVEKAIAGIECFIFKGLNQASTDFNGPLKGAL